MVDTTWAKKIKDRLKEGKPAFQSELKSIIGNPDRSIISGYLKCLVDLGEIDSIEEGNSKVYFIKGDLK